MLFSPFQFLIEFAYQKIRLLRYFKQENIMKKLLISTLCVASLALVACDKKPHDNNASGAGTATTAPAVQYSTNNNADIKSDLTQVQTLSNTRAQEAVNFQTEIMKSAQTGDQNAVKDTVSKMKSFVEGFNKDLDNLTLKSSEVDNFRNKMKETNTISIEMAEAGLSSPPDMNKITELQKKAADNQKEMLTIMQTLQTKANEAK